MDWIPDFWNFLLGLDRNDLIAELVQNDLDHGATITEIHFEKDRIICQGNGQPVDAHGWQRLRIMRGAGDRVPAKRGKIGVKNHGLKTAFTIGDEIRLLSDGREIIQTLYRRGRDQAPYPGASSQPSAQPAAPQTGCRVEISYRTKRLEPQEGEAFVFAAIDDSDIEDLFKDARDNIPHQFFGIVSPEVVPQYEIVLQHWRLGKARFLFSCTRLRKVTKNLEIFRRRCEASGNADDLPSILREEAARNQLPLKGQLKDRIPDFFRRDRRYFVEVSWPVDTRGRPQRGIGRFRYPIGYPVGSLEARTGHGLTFNAPFVSDTERHGPSPNDASNDDLREACEDLLVDVLSRRIVEQWRTHAIHLLIPDPKNENSTEIVRPLLARLAEHGGIPTIKKEDAIRLLNKAEKRGRQRRLPKAIRRQARRYKFIIPEASWSKGEIQNQLAQLSPPGEQQLHPKVDPQIVSILTDDSTNGWCHTFITFDQNDAFARLNGEGNDFFEASPDPRAEIADLSIARAYLDVILSSIRTEVWDEEKENEVKTALVLPDSRGKPESLSQLYLSAQIPLDIPGLQLPPILHHEIASHPLFRRKRWRLNKYTMRAFLESGTLEGADEPIRRHFWQWLRGNSRKVGPQELARLAEYPIWPDRRGTLHRLLELCEPQSQAVASRLGDVVARPSEQLRRSGLVRLGGRGKTGLRQLPTSGELKIWLERRISRFAIGATADIKTEAALDRLEAELLVLLKDQSVGRQLLQLSVSLPALAQDGTVQRRTDLIVRSKNIDRLALPSRFVLAATGRVASLDRLSAPIEVPVAPMLLAAFQEDAENHKALQARLRALLSLTDVDDAIRQEISTMAIISLHGRLYPPRALAFAGPRDYWGDWKIRLSAKGLSQDNQKRYIEAGVTESTPTPDTSHAFFGWLTSQPSTNLERHIPCILRHVLHPCGPQAWAEAYVDVPFIPVRSRDGVRLVSLQHARHRRILLPDLHNLHNLSNRLLKSDAGVSIVIDRVKEVREPASEVFRRFGIKGLRKALGTAIRVWGHGKTERAGDNLTARFRLLYSAKFVQTFYKRLAELDVDINLVWRDWSDRISAIEDIYFADEVNARFRLGRYTYDLATNGGFDRDSGAFWVKNSQQNTSSTFFETLAAQLIFRPVMRRVELLALERTLELEIRDPSFGHAVAGDVAESEADEAESSDIWDDDAETTEATVGHSPFKPNPNRNIPKPKPIRTRSSKKQPPSTATSDPHHHPKELKEPDRTPELEREQLDDLKTQHYASHCQMCLCQKTPSELAPDHSYVEWEEVRRVVIHGHHVDPRSGGGARHVGNIILLCKFHHENFGRRLSRETVTAALDSCACPKRLEFGIEDAKASILTGHRVGVKISDTEEVIELFFTEQHRDYWLTHSRS